MDSPISGARLIDGFVPNHAALLAWAIANVPWDDRIQARKTASYGVPYHYAGLTYAEVPFPPQLDRVRAAVSAHIGVDFNNCLLNFYPDGRARMGFHSDSAMGLVEGTGVAIVSLGATRPLRFRRIERREERQDLVLTAGSLLFMDLSVQNTWEHAIPRRSYAEPRISLTFRAVIEGQPVPERAIRPRADAR